MLIADDRLGNHRTRRISSLPVDADTTSVIAIGDLIGKRNVLYTRHRRKRSSYPLHPLYPLRRPIPGQLRADDIFLVIPQLIAKEEVDLQGNDDGSDKDKGRGRELEAYQPLSKKDILLNRRLSPLQRIHRWQTGQYKGRVETGDSADKDRQHRDPDPGKCRQRPQ